MVPGMKDFLLEPDFVDLLLRCHVDQVSDGQDLVSARFDWKITHLLTKHECGFRTPIGGSIVLVISGCIGWQVLNDAPCDCALSCGKCAPLSKFVKRFQRSQFHRHSKGTSQGQHGVVELPRMDCCRLRCCRIDKVPWQDLGIQSSLTARSVRANKKSGMVEEVNRTQAIGPPSGCQRT